jgi:GR25 family glycosyltransferase involved in LPS biosynthesis
MTIPTFIINLKVRSDRFEHIKKEFDGRSEFGINIVEAHTNKFGNIGLWNTMKHIIKDLANPEDEFILICEDDHLFTAEYSLQNISEAIAEAQEKNADVLLGGLSWFEDAVQVSNKLFSVKKFTGTQFTIIFRKFFPKVLEAEFGPQNTADAKIASLSDSVYFTSSFISVQKEFGYSDATEINDGTQRVQSLFIRSIVKAKTANNVRSYFLNSFSIDSISRSIFDNDDWTIPTYIINLPERKDRKAHIWEQFDERLEFDVEVVEAVKHDIGAFGHWQSIRKVIKLAMENDDDVIVICEDDHEFTPQYSKTTLFKNISIAHNLGCEYLSGGAGRFDLAVPISENLFWTDHCLSTQFVIIFKKLFQKILDVSFDEDIIGDIRLSELAANKMLLVPFISTQKDIGLSDITKLHNDQTCIVQEMFKVASFRADYMQLVYTAHKQQAI